jgi:HEAT repeat protein
MEPMLEKRKKALKDALADSEPSVRDAAAAALDQLEGLDNLPQLLTQLAEGDRRTRIAVVYALGRIQSSKIFVPLLEALKADDPDLRSVAARILGEKRHPKTLGPLVKALAEPEVGVAAEIATALGQFDDPRLPKVLGSLIKREEQIALAAIDSIGKIGLPDGEDALLAALTDERPALRSHAATALGKLKLANH